MAIINDYIKLILQDIIEVLILNIIIEILVIIYYWYWKWWKCINV